MNSGGGPQDRKRFLAGRSGEPFLAFDHSFVELSRIRKVSNREFFMFMVLLGHKEPSNGVFACPSIPAMAADRSVLVHKSLRHLGIPHRPRAYLF